MNEEEAKRILIELSTFDYVKLENGDVAIESVLNLLEKKDAIINKMSEMLVEDKEWFYSEFDNYSKEQFKDYFTNLVEKENK